MVFNSTKAPASGFSAQGFIKQVLLPLFPHSSWEESSWPCSFNPEASAFLVLHRNLRVSPCLWTGSTQKIFKVQILSCSYLAGREVNCFLGQLFFFFFPLTRWWHLLGGHTEAAPNLASKKGSYCFGEEEVSSPAWGVLLLIMQWLKSARMVLNTAKNSIKDNPGK